MEIAYCCSCIDKYFVTTHYYSVHEYRVIYDAEYAMKNITLSADANLIEKCRKRARRENTTLNAVFRQWLSRYAGRASISSDFLELMEQFSYARSGRTFTREELNER